MGRKNANQTVVNRTEQRGQPATTAFRGRFWVIDAPNRGVGNTMQEAPNVAGTFLSWGFSGFSSTPHEHNWTAIAHRPHIKLVPARESPHQKYHITFQPFSAQGDVDVETETMTTWRKPL
jgi:hypothetical protein